MKILLCIFFNFVFCFLVFSQTDSNSTSSKDSSISATIEITEVHKNIRSDIDSLIILSKRNTEILENAVLENSFWDTSLSTFVSGLIIGILASIFVLIGDRYCKEMKLKKTFKYLEGSYQHTGENVRPNCFSNLEYKKGGKFLIKTTTKYGNWEGRIVMDIDLPHYGSGLFNYEGKQEDGLLNIIVKDKKHIYVFPSTLTHEAQRINFYILERV